MLKFSLVLVPFKYAFELLVKQNQERNIAAGHRQIWCQYTGSDSLKIGRMFCLASQIRTKEIICHFQHF